MKNLILQFSVLILLFQATHARAQSGPSWHQPILPCDFCIASQGISPLEMGSSGIRYDLRYVVLDRRIHDGTKLENPAGEYASHLTSQLTLTLHALDHVALNVILPYVDRNQHTLADDGVTMNTNNNSGLGDLTLIGRYIAVSDHSLADNTMLSINAGVKLPTANTSKRDANGDLLEPDFQLGTGAWTGIVGASLLLGYDEITFASNLTFALNGSGANNHRYGNNLNYDLTARYRLYPAESEDFSIFGTLGVTGEWRGRETADGATDDNSGGDVTYIAPGFQIFFMPGLSLEASYHIAVVNALHGDQLGERFRIMSGIQYMF